MLVLTRKIGEKICIGDDVVMTVVECGFGKVRIGIEAPPDIRIDRQEIRDARKEQERQLVAH